MNLAEHLVLIETFQGLDDEQYAALAARFEKYRAGVGEAIIKQGDLINRFVIVEEGVVVLRHTDPSGTVSIVDTLAAGRYFGEQMFTTQELANYDADAANGPRTAQLATKPSSRQVCRLASNWPACSCMRESR